MRQQEIIEHCVGRDGLWKFGVSGDFPTLFFNVPDDSDSISAAERLITEHQALRSLGVRYDLILGMHDCMEYGNPTQLRLGRDYDGVCFADALSPELPKLLAMVDLVL
jgi:hypothetical protein